MTSMSNCCFSKCKEIWGTGGRCNFWAERMSHSHNECFAKPVSGFKTIPQSSQISTGERERERVIKEGMD